MAGIKLHNAQQYHSLLNTKLDHNKITKDQYVQLSRLYTKFLKIELAPHMLAPLGPDGIPLEIPKNYSEYCLALSSGLELAYGNIGELTKYKKAMDKVLFTGFEILPADRNHAAALKFNGDIICYLDSDAWKMATINWLANRVDVDTEMRFEALKMIGL